MSNVHGLNSFGTNDADSVSGMAPTPFTGIKERATKHWHSITPMVRGLLYCGFISIILSLFLPIREVFGSCSSTLIQLQRLFTSLLSPGSFFSSLGSLGMLSVYGSRCERARGSMFFIFTFFVFHVISQLCFDIVYAFNSGVEDVCIGGYWAAVFGILVMDGRAHPDATRTLLCIPTKFPAKYHAWALFALYQLLMANSLAVDIIGALLFAELYCFSASTLQPSIESLSRWENMTLWGIFRKQPGYVSMSDTGIALVGGGDWGEPESQTNDMEMQDERIGSRDEKKTVFSGTGYSLGGGSASPQQPQRSGITLADRFDTSSKRSAAIESLTSMGFELSDVEYALSECRDDVDLAREYLERQ